MEQLLAVGEAAEKVGRLAVAEEELDSFAAEAAVQESLSAGFADKILAAGFDSGAGSP